MLEKWKTYRILPYVDARHVRVGVGLSNEVDQPLGELNITEATYLWDNHQGFALMGVRGERGEIKLSFLVRHDDPGIEPLEAQAA